MLERSVLQRVLDEAIKKGGDFAELYYEEKQMSQVIYEDERVDKITSGREKGAGIRVIKDGNTAYVYTNDLSEEGLIKAASTASKALGKAEPAQEKAISLSGQEPGIGRISRDLLWDLTYADKINQLLAANQVVRNLGEEIRQVTMALSDIHKEIQIANSDGELLEDAYSRVRLGVNAVASRNGLIQSAYESAGAVSGWEILDKIDFTTMAEKAGRLALKMLSAAPAPAGSMPVVLAGEAGGTMVHEACGHGLEADLVQKGLSVYQGKYGEMVAAPGVTVIDDATLEGHYGSFRMDDEGQAAERSVLIQDGELQGFMYDRLTASQEKKDSSGNGRRESYQHKPIPRMSNTFIAPGREEAEKIIKATPRGLLVKKMGGGQVNTINGDFVFDVQEAYLIEGGEIKEAVRGATLTGNGPRVLRDIDMLGNDLGFTIGVCGKDGQGVPVSDGQPTMRIKELTVGGTASPGGPQMKKIKRK